MKLEVSKKKVIIDGVLNILAAALPIIALQLVIFPIIAKNETNDTYGLMITIYAVFMLLPNIFGNAICNVRLVENSKYEKSEVAGDFNLIVIKYGIISSSIVFFILFYYYNDNDIIGICLSFIISILTYMNAYFEVYFSIHLEFYNRLLLRCFLVIGYAFGLLFYFVLNRWELVFLLGQLFTSIFIFMRSDLYKEKLVKTFNYNSVNRDCYFLIVAGLLASSLDYVDRLILLPLVGGELVSIYYVAALMGKLIIFIIPPIKTLILSYISHIDKLSKKHFIIIILCGIIICCIMYLLCLSISPLILKILYSQYASEAIRLVPIVTISALISGLGSIIQVFVMRYCKMKWQLIINGISVGTFFIVSIILLQAYGIVGFCIGNIIGYIIKLFGLIIVYLSINKSEGVKISD